VVGLILLEPLHFGFITQPTKRCLPLQFIREAIAIVLFWKALVLTLGGCQLRWRSQMTDLHESGDPKYTAQIDTAGWIFVVFAVAITVIAAVVAYHGSRAMIANTPASHVAGSPG
jgi:hypothetical protein